MSSYFTNSPVIQAVFEREGELVTYEKGQHVVWHKDESSWVYHLVSGHVRVCFNLSDDVSRMIGFFAPGSVFAQNGSFFQRDNGGLSYTAETEAVTRRISRQRFFELVESSPEFAREYLGIILRNQLFLIDRIVYQGEKGLYAKFLRWLSFMARYYGTNAGTSVFIDIPISQETIADFLHATRESVNVTMRRLVREGVISVSHKRISILDTNDLERRITEEAARSQE